MSLDESRLSRIRTPLLLVSVAVLVWAALGALDVGNFTYSGYATDGNNTITRVTEGGPADRGAPDGRLRPQYRWDSGREHTGPGATAAAGNQ